MAERTGKHFNAKRERSCLEILADRNRLLIQENTRIIICCIKLPFKYLTNKIKRIKHRTMDCRGTAKAKRVLQCARAIRLIEIAPCK